MTDDSFDVLMETHIMLHNEAERDENEVKFGK